jgi:hypothetical protein
MVKKLAVPLFILALGVASTPLRAASHQSVDLPAPAPAAAGGAGSTQQDDLRLAVKANDLPPIGSSSIDLITGETAAVVTAKAAQALCQAAYSTSGVTCTPAAGPACSGIACCDNFLTLGILVAVDCIKTGGGKGVEILRTAGLPNEVQADAIFGGSITNMGVENKNIYTEAGHDIAAKELIQIRPNGVTGTITFRIFHNQGGTNPRLATVAVTTSNNDPSEAAALHAAIETALENISPALPIPLTGTPRGLNDAKSPLTAFGWFKQATNFTEISNAAAASIIRIEVVVPAGMGVTIEGSDGVSDGLAGIPTLNTYGIVVLVATLLLAGYLLKRRQTMGGAKA